MRFLSPWWLLLLVAVAGLAAVYVWFQLRRPGQAVRFTNLDLLDAVAPARPGWRKHVVAAMFGLALVLVVVALAQPVRDVRVPKEEASIVLAIDTSLSMQADDVDPSRIEAAQDAASQFVAAAPEELNIGVVGFDGSATVHLVPSQDRDAAAAAIAGLDLGEGTAIGDAISASLSAIADVPVAPGAEAPPGAVVLLSDGESTDGVPVSAAVDEANEAAVPVSTIAFGTADAAITVDGEVIPVPVDEASLAELAAETGGTAFDAETAEELDAVYADIGSQIGYDTEERDISRWFLGAALITMLVCAGLSLAWSSRIL